MNIIFNNIQNQNKHTLIKMCGFTCVQDLQAAINNNVDAIGLVFYSKSKRYVSIEQAKILTSNIPKHIQIVGLFVNETIDNIVNICEQVNIDILQLHGDMSYETPDWCKKCSQIIKKPYIKAIGIDNNCDEEFILTSYTKYSKHNASGILLDTKTSSYGGSGKTFNWNIIPKSLLNKLDIPIIISGGINADNLLDVLNLQPYAIDLSSAIENNIKGIKDAYKIKRIMQIIKSKEKTHA